MIATETSGLVMEYDAEDAVQGHGRAVRRVLLSDG